MVLDGHHLINVLKFISQATAIVLTLIIYFAETGGLFMLAIRLMQLFSDNKSDFTKLTGILGLYFQIRDDYCNLSLKEVSFKQFTQFCLENMGSISLLSIHHFY